MNKWISKTMSVALAATLVFPLAGNASAAAAAGSAAEKLLPKLPLYELHTIAGTGQAGQVDGESNGAAFRQPSSVVELRDGTLMVADTGNSAIRAIKSNKVSTYAGLTLGYDEYGFPIGAFANGAAALAAFQRPAGLAVDSSGRLVVADAENHAIRRISGAGEVTTLAGNGLLGNEDGTGSEALLYNPLAVAVARSGAIYFADTLNHAIRKLENGRVITLNAPSDRVMEYFPGAVEWVGDYVDGPLAEAKFNEPSGLALDSKGNLYVSDTGNNRIRYIDFSKGTVTTVAGGGPVAYEPGNPYATGGYADGAAEQALFRAPKGIALDNSGGLLIADSLNHAVRYLKGGQVITIAGTPEESGNRDGLSLAGGLNHPTGVTVLRDGSFAIADSGNNLIRHVKPYNLPAGLKLDGTVNLVLGQQILKPDADPRIIRGTTFVPLRIILEHLGYEVEYGQDERVTVAKGALSYTIIAGSAEVKKVENGKETTIKLLAAPFREQGRTFLPVRFFAEESGLDVQWLSESRTVLLRTPLF